MARYIQDAGINQPLDVVSDTMEEYIHRNRYIRTDWNGEVVYLSTDSAAKGNRYLIWHYTSGILHIEAWLKGSFNREVGLIGAGNKKRTYKESIDNLIETLRHPIKDETVKPTQPNTFEPYVPDYREEKGYKARRGLVYGVIALFGSFSLPIIGLIFGIIGLGNCKEGMESDMADKAKTGRVLCIIAIVWCFLRLLYYILIVYLSIQ